MNLLVYTETTTPRIEYILSFVLDDVLGINFKITTDIQEFEKFLGAKISYSNCSFSNSIQIVPHAIMLQNTILQAYNFGMEIWHKLPVFARTSDTANVEFDIFAASFYLLTRYEEYNASTDQHGRYNPQNSMASINGFLHLPLVDLWAYELLKLLHSTWPDLQHSNRKFKHIFSFDLDSSFAIKHKGVRAWASTAILLFKLKINDFGTRILVHFGIKDDPFNVFDRLFDELKSVELVKWFIHVGKYSKYDKPPCARNKHVKNIIRKISSKYEVGLHPSYSSFMRPKQLLKEKELLQSIVAKPIIDSRYHYLRFTLPNSYQQLVQLGILTDYSMGYANTFGFRAGTCTPFKYFDLQQDKVSNLTVYPFYCMDSIIAKRSENEQLELIQQIKSAIDIVAQVNGTFISIWHIDYFSGYPKKNNHWTILNEIKNHTKKYSNGN